MVDLYDEYKDTCTQCGRHLYAFCEDAVADKTEHIGWGFVGDQAMCVPCMLDKLDEPRCPHWVASDYVHDKETAWRCGVSEPQTVQRILDMGAESLSPDMHENLEKAMDGLRKVRKALKEKP